MEETAGIPRTRVPTGDGRLGASEVIENVSMSPAPPPPPPDTPAPSITLDAKGILDFVEKQNDKERAYFDKLLKWFASFSGVMVLVFSVLGIQNCNQINQIRQNVQNEAKEQLKNAIIEEFSKERIQSQITAELQRKTQSDFQTAINKAIADELNRPDRQKLIQEAVDRKISERTANRKLTDEQKQTILRLLNNNTVKPKAPETVTIYSVGAQEANDYARELAAVFEKSMWKPYTSFDGAAVFEVIYQGVVILVPDAKNPSKVALALQNILKEAKVLAVHVETGRFVSGEGVILCIGTKNY